MFRSAAVRDVVTTVADCFGLAPMYVFPVKNYENEVDLDYSIDILVLLALKQLVNFMDECFGDTSEPKKKKEKKSYVPFWSNQHDQQD